MANEKTSHDSAQGGLLFLGLSFGVVPLVRVTFFGGGVSRLLSWVPGTDAAPGSWLVPVVVIVVCVIGIALLERAKET